MTIRIGVMGGTFDPLHLGHLVAASEAAHRFALDRVIFVPTGQPWQKPRADLTAPEIRYLMTAAATATDQRFGVSRVDVDRPGPTYAVDTLRDIAGEFPGASLFFITGADALSSILTWRDPTGILSQAHFIGVTRPGHQLTDSHLPDGAATLLEVPSLAISSTACRARVSAGEPISYLVPREVEAIIAKYALYRASEP